MYLTSPVLFLSNYQVCMLECAVYCFFISYFGLVSVGIYLTCVSQVFPLCRKHPFVYVQLLSGPNICLHALVLPVSMFAFVCGFIFPCRLCNSLANWISVLSFGLFISLNAQLICVTLSLVGLKALSSIYLQIS